MSAVCTPASSSSVSCALGDGCFHPKLHHRQQQLHHSLGRAQTAISSSFFGGDDACKGSLLQHRHGRFSRVATQSSCLSYLCKLSGHGGLLHNQHWHDQLGLQKATASSSVDACVCNGSHLQFEQPHLCFTLPSPFSFFGCPRFGGLVQQRFTRVWAHSKQHLSLQEDQERLLRIQQRREALQKHQAAILDSITQHQASLQQSTLLSINSQTEEVTGRYVPEGFDASTCRSVFVGNLHRKVTDTFLTTVFSTIGPLAACRLIKKDKSSYGFVEFQDHRAAAMAISTLNGRKLFKLPIRVNWAFSGEGLPENHRIFVGDLSTGVTEDVLFKFFSIYPSCIDARVIWDTRSGRSKGYGFVCFKQREDADKAVAEMTGKMLCDKAIRCDLALDNDTVVEGPPGQEAVKVDNKKGLNNNPRYMTVYVGNLPYKVTQEEVQEVFNRLGVGLIEEVYVAKWRGYGFVRYSTHEAAALAIKAGDGKILGERPIKCSWGTKPNTLLGLSDSAALVDQPSESSPITPSVEEMTLVEG